MAISSNAWRTSAAKWRNRESWRKLYGSGEMASENVKEANRLICGFAQWLA